MEGNPSTTSRGGIWFLIIVLFLYLAAYFVDAEKTIEAGGFSSKLLYQILPILLLVFVLLFVANLLVKPRWVKAHLGESSGLKGWIIASIGGILSVGSIYPWFALLKELRDKGMRPALISVFLYNRAIKLPLLPLLVHYFGLTYTLILIAYIIVFSLLSGLLMEKLIDFKIK